MASRQPIFRAASEHGDDNEKLVELFRNRSELKKEFVALNKERYRLQQLIKEEQGATARVTQRLEYLESLLVDPDWAHTVVVFYQLRALNRRCQGKLAKFAEQLKKQREKRARDAQLKVWRDTCNGRRAKLDSELDKLRAKLRLLEEQLQAERQRAESMSRLSRLFRGRAAAGELSDLTAQVDAARQAEQALLEKVAAIEKAPPPDPPGLSIADKRSINFMIVAFAQQLYLQFDDRNLVALVKESSEKSVGAINYGGKPDCDRLLKRIAEHVALIEKTGDCADALKQRAELIAEHALFKEDDDAAPVAGTVATVFGIQANGVVAKLDANLVGDNYWGIANVLSR